jgi:hypothetical protein
VYVVTKKLVSGDMKKTVVSAITNALSWFWERQASRISLFHRPDQRKNEPQIRNYPAAVRGAQRTSRPDRSEEAAPRQESDREERFWTAAERQPAKQRDQKELRDRRRATKQKELGQRLSDSPQSRKIRRSSETEVARTAAE